MNRQRDRPVNIRMNDDEVEMLKTLAHESGLSASDIVRQLIRREYAEKQGPGKPAKKPKR